MSKLYLRAVVDDDLPTFYEHQLDADANYMAAFTAKDPGDRVAFEAHWRRILADPGVVIRAIVCDDAVAGHVLSYTEAGKPEVSYWIGKAHWNQGVATRALAIFLAEVNPTRPMYARVAKDNLASRRVLRKCGFQVLAEATGFANARGQDIEELILELL